MQKITEPPLKKCPHCGKSQLQRLMSAPVFRLKGGGWYETDFKGDQDNKRNLADRPDADKPKEESKEKAKEGDKAADGKTADAKAPESKDAAKSPDKAADKPAPKASGGEGSKKTVKSKRGASPVRKATKKRKARR
jgi:predicted nucleic acid-binding Zn ribbon protein